MTATLARREREALCDLALDSGPGAATLCGDWTAQELLAHLFVREHRPLGAVGMFVPGLDSLADASMARAGRTAYPELVEKVRRPGLTPFALRPVEVLVNTLEYVVHHEDLRRAMVDWEPRTLDPADLDTVWSAISRMGKLMVRSAGVPVTLRRGDTGAEATLRGGGEPAVIEGPVIELVLYLFGRDAVRDVEITGPDDAVAALRRSDLGL